MTTILAVAVALLHTPFTWVIVAGFVVGAVLDRPVKPSKKRRTRVGAVKPLRTKTPHFGALAGLSSIAERKSE